MRNPEDVERFIESLDFSLIRDADFIADPQHPYAPDDLVYVLLSRNGFPNYRKLLGSGIMFGYGNGISYGQEGILILGYPSMGKTSLVDGLMHTHPDKITNLSWGFSEDTLLLSNPPGNNTPRIHRLPDAIDGKSWSSTLKNCIEFTQQDPGFSMGKIILLDHLISRPVGFLQRNRRGILSKLAKDYLYGLEIDYSVLDNVDLLYYNNPHSRHTLEQMTQNVARILNEP